MNSDNYNYENPITRIQNQLLEEMVKKEEDQFMCEVRQTIGYNIDKSEWMKCSEKMPENGKNVLVVITQDGYTDICVGETYGEGNWMISGEFWYEKSDPAITHWMPLPELPKGER